MPVLCRRNPRVLASGGREERPGGVRGGQWGCGVGWKGKGEEVEGGGLGGEWGVQDRMEGCRMKGGDTQGRRRGVGGGVRDEEGVQGGGRRGAGGGCRPATPIPGLPLPSSGQVRPGPAEGTALSPCPPVHPWGGGAIREALGLGAGHGGPRVVAQPPEGRSWGGRPRHPGTAPGWAGSCVEPLSHTPPPRGGHVPGVKGTGRGGGSCGRGPELKSSEPPSGEAPGRPRSR